MELLNIYLRESYDSYAVYFLSYWFVCTWSYNSVLAELIMLCSTQGKVEKGDSSKSIHARVRDLVHITFSLQALSIHVYEVPLQYNSISRTEVKGE